MVARSPLLNVMLKAADKAAKSLKRDFGEVEHLQISRKGPADFVSTADMQAQRILREELGKARPNFGFLMEEADGALDTSGHAERWIVDPLDGTTNFLHAVPHWAISIAAERDGEIVAGVVYDAAKDEIFTAEKGVGAYLNNKRLRVSARTDLADCLIATGTPFKGVAHRQPRYIEKLTAVMAQVAGVRRFGSAALDLAYVAAGRFEGYWEEGLGAHDVAAGILLVKEAGGFVVPVDPAKKPLEGSLIASNNGIHTTLVELLRKA